MGLPEGNCLRWCGHRFLMQGAQHRPHAAAVLPSIGSCSLAHGSHRNPNRGSEPQISTEMQDVPETWLPSSAEIHRVSQDTGPLGITSTTRQHLCRNSRAVTTHGDTVTHPPAQCHPLCFVGEIIHPCPEFCQISATGWYSTYLQGLKASKPLSHKAKRFRCF